MATVRQLGVTIQPDSRQVKPDDPPASPAAATPNTGLTGSRQLDVLGEQAGQAIEDIVTRVRRNLTEIIDRSPALAFSIR